MKMYKKPISKNMLEQYLALDDLSLPKNGHSISLLYQQIKNRMEEKHPNSKVLVYRKDPIVSVENNYDKLLIQKDNISRSSTYTHYINESKLLRTHTSANIPEILEDLSKKDNWNDVLILLPGLAYRRDVADKKHVGQIHMLEMWRVVKTGEVKQIEKADLLDAVRGIADVAAPGWKLRIEDSPHPYTNGGIEVNAVHEDGRDIEILECGLIKEKILENAGLDSGTYSGWALGMGLDRLVMTIKDIPDIRYLRSSNPRIAEQMKDLNVYKEVSSKPAITRDMSYSVPSEYVEEDISQDIIEALDKDIESLEEVEILSETSYTELNEIAREKLGISESQKNVLVRVTLRRLDRTLTNEEANKIYASIYPKINKGSKGYM